ncbi:TRAP transporter large permease [Lentisphaera profundi]|uniref:TRAP transporter large permease n=1 Tax=Lentisphaera profundi TaxID=1658616 RepID=A0ABY7VPG9_9BACT|nr:TRAP transporter large permease [Lentisphaera profundi]WDE95614.1 TRAP transporter large permease [Lentisphaera profundi]
MDTSILILIAVFGVLLISNVPVAVSIALASFATLAYLGGMPAETIVSFRMASGVNSFALLAIPFFILAGNLMGRGGIARRLINFAATLVGALPGGLAYVNVISCMFFGAISGSAVAAVSSIGGFMIPSMEEKGYDREYSVALTTTAATTGMMIPPSNIMIVYCLVSGGVSVGAMFLAGVIPGIICGLCLMLTAGFIAKKRGYAGGERATLAQVFKAFREAFMSLMLIVIVLGGILSGFFTATEAAAIAVVYALIQAVVMYKEVKLKELPGILRDSGITTAVVMLLVGASMGMSWLMAYQEIPQNVSKALLGVSDNPWVLFIIINLLLLVVGTFMDMTPAVLIFTPILLPVFIKISGNAELMGVPASTWIPIHFGIIMVANLSIGLCTPPVGTCLFVGCGVGKSSISKVTRPMIPFFLAMVVSLLFITFFPTLSLWLPKVFGQFN